MAQSMIVHNLGQMGIDIVNSPLHIVDGSLVNCQNAQLKPVDAELAIVKRDGMSKINSIAAAGTILAIVNIPLVNP